MNVTSTEILFEKFEVIETLKKDSNTSVFLATHIYLGKKIILKTLNTDDLGDKTLLDRFKREAKILARLEHPNLIKVLDFGTHGNHFYISFEYFQSRNLREVIKNNNLTEENKTQLLIQLLNALNIAHQTNIIHRDIKPENILVDENLNLKIADFGLAFVQNDHTLTQKSSIVGTPSYMSPEQIRGENLSPQTDLFSAGIVALELFTGSNPFLGKNINETINKILNFEEDFILESLKNIDGSTFKAINSMLRKNRNQRAESAMKVLDYLGVEGESLKSLIQNKSSKFIIQNKSKKIPSYLYVLIPLLLAGAAFAFWFSQNSDGLFTSNLIVENPNRDLYTQLIETDANYVLIRDLPIGIEEQEELSSLAAGLPGRLFVDVSPWADVYINNRLIETTPLTDYIELTPGRYSLRLIHPDYPSYTRRIEIASDKIETIRLDLKDMIGFLDININPWGDVYINGELKGTTPLREPLLLYPGTYKVAIVNPQYGTIERQITIRARETHNFNFNFDEDTGG
jgi:eukaryotic-like serine/threonine-protein kinase